MSSPSIIPSSQARVLFLHVSAGVLPKSFQSYSFLISFQLEWFHSLSDSVSLRFSPFSSFLSSSRVFLTLFILTILFLFHLIPFSFRLGPKTSGRDLLLVEECCNAPDSMH